MKHIVHWGYDDWYGLFVDGELYDEGHGIPMWLLERASNGEPFTFEDRGNGELLVGYFESHGRFEHKKLADVESLVGWSK